MSDVWHPLDPEGSRPQEPSGQDRGPDPEPIVRTVRVAFLLAGMVVAVMVNAGLNGKMIQSALTLLDAQPDVLNHNTETIARLYRRVRPDADYQQSLTLLRRAAARREDLVNLTVNGEVQDPASGLGEHAARRGSHDQGRRVGPHDLGEAPAAPVRTGLGVWAVTVGGGMLLRAASSGPRPIRRRSRELPGGPPRAGAGRCAR